MAFRTVSVELLAKVGHFKREMTSSKPPVKDLKQELNELAKAGDLSAVANHDAARAAKTLGDESKKSGKDVKTLSKQLFDMDIQLRKTAMELERTGNLDLVKDIQRQQRELWALVKVRKDILGIAFGGKDDDKSITEAGRKAGVNLAGGVVDSFSKSLSAGGSTVVGAVIGVVAAAAPFLGASIAAAVLGGVGTGGIIGGIAAASRDPRVRAEAQELGKTFSGVADVIGEPFVGPTIEALRILNKETKGWASDLQEGLSSVAPVITPLTLGLDGLVDKTMPGLTKGLGTAKVALRALGNELPELGEDFSAMFEDMAENPEAVAAAMHDLVTIVGETGRAIGVTTKFLSSYYEVLIKTGEVTTGWANDMPNWVKQITPLAAVADYFDGNVDAMKRAADASHDYRDVTQAVTTTEYRFGSAISSTTGELEDQRQAMLGLVGTTLDLRRSTQDIEQAIDDFSEAVDENGTSLDVHTEKGRRNIDTVEAGIDALLRGSNATYENARATGATALEAEEAAARYRATWIPALLDGAVKAGFNRDQVALLMEALNKLDGRRITYYLVQKGGKNIGAKVPGGYIPAGNDDERRWGGVTVHAQTGMLRDAGIYTPRSPARYAFAEPATQGEAFIPKSGDYGRSMSILSQAASWYGASVTRGGGTQTVVHEHRHTVVIQGREMISGFRREVDLAGGSSDDLLGRRRF